MAKADQPIAAVHVGVKNGGCAGMSYYMEYAEKIDPLDEVIEDKGVRIVIDRYPVAISVPSRNSQLDGRLNGCATSAQ